MQSNGLRGQVNVRLSLDLLRKARAKSKRTGIELSTLLRAALEKWVRGEWSPFIHSLSEGDDESARE